MVSNEETILNTEAFKKLSDEEKKAALEILQQLVTTGNSSLLNDLKYNDFEEIPVDINTFIDDDKYLGKGIWAIDNISQERYCTLFPYWRQVLNKLFPTNLTTAYNTLILTGAIGLGKAQPLDSVILTESGFKKMKDITLEDRVYGNDGELHNIIGIFPQGKKKICKVSFTDKTSTLCCDEHLWTVYNTKNKVWTTIETKQLIDGSRNLKYATGHRYKIPITLPINFQMQETLIDPYILGVLIGDGCFATTARVQFASVDSEILEAIKSNLPNTIELKKLSGKYNYSITSKIQNKNEYLTAIKKYGLNTKAEFMHIPVEYLQNNIQTRISLLQGLMDIGGYISKDGTLIKFTTISEQLKNDFIWLIQSLGGICHIRTKHSSYFSKKLNKKIESHLSYSIGIKLPKDICPFKLTRKKERLNTTARNPSRYITNIEYIGEDECQCIYIDSKEHLYLTNDFIVTHNTLIAAIAMAYLLYRMLCLKDPYAYYGMMPSDKITFSMLNITLDAARGVGWDKIQQLIQGSSWFMAHGELNSSRVNPTWQPPKGIELIFGSNNRHVVGRALFCNLTDECLDGDTEICTTNGSEKLKDLVNKDIQVVSIDSTGQKCLSDKCTVKPTIKTNEEYQIELEDGTTIKCTGNHKLMLIDGTYKRADKLTPQDELFESNITYNSFINEIIKQRGQWSENIRSAYCERHHIIPKCLGGLPKKLTWEHHKNIIWLTAKEHFIAHKLLAKENPNNYYLVTAFKRMCYSCHTDFKITAENINFVKQTWGKLHSKQLKGYKQTKPRIIKNKQAYSLQKSLQCRGSRNPMYKKGFKIAGSKNGCYGKPVIGDRLNKIKIGNTKWIYTYNNKSFFGWYELQKYLKSLGYGISQTGIEACVSGKQSIKKYYPTLFLAIKKTLKQDSGEI